jgi:Raf kinase inhibitor-like YbhB/YbcL family protein
MSSLGQRVKKALRSVRSGEEKLAIHRLEADGLPRLTIASDSFAQMERMPDRLVSSSPDLHVDGIPGGAAELAVIVEDPDAPTPMPFVHWLVYGIPIAPGQTTAEIPYGVSEGSPVARQGKTTMRHEHYDGPAPPPGHGVHHYHFQVFALDGKLDLEAGTGRTELLDAMEGHVIAVGELIGTYER